jgi:hypothetical protein
MEPLKIPVSDHVTSIEVTFLDSFDKETKQYKRRTVLKEREKVAAAISQLNELNTEMYRPLDTFPIPTHTIIVNDRDHLGLVVFVGRNWIGGQNNIAGDSGKARLRIITDEQRAFLLESVGMGEHF